MQSGDAPFLKLHDLVLPPPLPALVAVLFALGTLWLGRRIAFRLRPTSLEPIDLAAGFVIAAGGIAAGVHILAVLQLLYLPLLRVGGCLILAAGTAQARAMFRACPEWWRQSLPRIRQCGPAALIPLAISAVILLGIGLTVLGPVFDEDSLNYHLSVPLEWLRHGGAFPTPYWVSSRLVGLGENWNLLGLALGTDGLGAMMQFAGMIIAMTALVPPSSTLADSALQFLLVAAVPNLIFLGTSQKPQLLPAAATTLAIVLLHRRRERIDGGTLVLAAGSCAVAVGCKYSFLLSGGVVLVYGLAVARRKRALALGIAAAALAVFVLPVYGRNLLFYGDPLSPLLEPTRAVPDPAVVALRTFMHDLGRGEGFRGLALLPVTLLLPPSNKADAANFLGIGVLSFILALRSRRTRPVLLASLSAVLILVVFSQWTARFFLEPYLWCAAAVGGAAGPTRPRQAMLVALCVQGIFTAALAWFYAAAFFPGALTPALREHVMTRSVIGYADSQWLDRALPRNARILPISYANVFWPRPYAASDRAVMLARTSLPVACRRRLLADQLRHDAISLVVLDSSRDPAPLEPLGPFIGRETQSAQIPAAVLIPWKTGTPRRLSVHELILPAAEEGISR